MPSRSEAARRRLPRLVAAVGLLAILGVAFPLTAAAAERASAQVVLVDAGDVITDDLYAAGNRVVVQGRIQGDLIAFAFEDVVITGTVDGDVIAVAGSVIVEGSVGGSLRLVAPSQRISGAVGGDVIVVGASVAVDGDAAGDALVWAWETAMTGSVGGSLEGSMRRLSLTGDVIGSVIVDVTELDVADGASVGGDLAYRSGREDAEIGDVEVGGVIEARRPLPANVRLRALVVLGKVVLVLGATMLGLLLMWSTPDGSAAAAKSVRSSWWRAWLRGLVVLLSPLLVVAIGAVIFSVTPPAAGFPLLLVLIPVLVAVLGLVAAVALASPAASFPWLGDRRGFHSSPLRPYLKVAGLVTVAAVVPYLAWVVALFVIPLGIGGWMGVRRTVAES